MANRNYTIQLGGSFERAEAIANAAILPGMLVELMSTSRVKPHATANGAAETAFAVENRMAGSGITDTYASGDKVQYNIIQRGGRVYCRIANGQTVVSGDKLVSNGDGYLKKYTPEASAAVLPVHPLAVALENVDMSGSSAVDPDGFCVARVM